jgi:putative SOS response-associated peptidase YedK
MPRGVLQGEPDTLGLPPYDRRRGDPCLVLMRHPDTGDAVAATLRWGLPLAADPRRRIVQLPVARLHAGRPARRARCLVPLDGYVQRGVKRTPIAVQVAGGMSLAAAAVWESGVSGACFAIITTEPNDVLSPAHARMPVLLPPSMWSSWIADGALSAADLAIIERPAPPAWLHARALRGAPARQPALSVARQLAELVPGGRLWDGGLPGEPANSNMTEHPRAVG